MMAFEESLAIKSKTVMCQIYFNNKIILCTTHFVLVVSSLVLLLKKFKTKL